MDSNFRGSYPPSSLIVPGPSGFPGPPPPQFLIPDPTAMFAEVLGAIHKEGLNQRQHVNDRFSSVVRGYTDMGTTYNECLRQTDRILAEQGARFEARLENVQKAIRQLNDSQTTAIATLNERLDSFEGLIESSRKSIDSEITTAVQTMGRRFFELSAGITNSHCSKPFHPQFLTILMFMRNFICRRSRPSRERNACIRSITRRYDRAREITDNPPKFPCRYHLQELWWTVPRREHGV